MIGGRRGLGRPGRSKLIADSKPQGGMSPEDLRSCSIAVYFGAVELDAADDIARRLRWAADTIEALTEALEQARARTHQAQEEAN